jgi:hypothetical protein
MSGYGWKGGLLMVLALHGCSQDSPDEAADRESILESPGLDSGPGTQHSDTTGTVSVTGFGGIRVGQELAEIESDHSGSFDISEFLGECAHMSLTDWPDGILAMVVEGRVVRIEVWNAAIATREGARIGMTESEIHALYPGQVEVLPHKYTDGHYLRVTPSGPDVAEHRIIFETDGEEVQRYRAGILPAVEWVEGCA